MESLFHGSFQPLFLENCDRNTQISSQGCIFRSTPPHKQHRDLISKLLNFNSLIHRSNSKCLGPTLNCRLSNNNITMSIAIGFDHSVQFCLFAESLFQLSYIMFDIFYIHLNPCISVELGVQNILEFLFDSSHLWCLYFVYKLFAY